MSLSRRPRKRRKFKPSAPPGEPSPYTPAVIKRIIRVALRGKNIDRRVKMLTITTDDPHEREREYSASEALKIRLDAAVKYAEFSQVWLERTPTTPQLFRAFVRIQRSARALLSALHVTEQNALPEVPEWLIRGGLHWQAANDPVAAARVVSTMPAGAPIAVVGRSLIRDAVCGVADLERWAFSQQSTLAAKIEAAVGREDAEGPDRDPERQWIVAMADIWRDVFERIDTGSRAFGDFVAEAGAPIGLRLDADASRKRLPDFGRSIRRSVGKSRSRR